MAGRAHGSVRSFVHPCRGISPTTHPAGVSRRTAGYARAVVAPPAQPTARRWTNWAGNQSFTPARFAAPASAEEVAELVAEAAAAGMGVRVAGAGHSFTPVVETGGLLLDLSNLSGVIGVDAARLRVV